MCRKGYVMDMEKVKNMMYSRFWTWRILAEKSNLTETTLMALQAKRRRASARTVYKIAAALKVKPETLIEKEA